MKRKLILHNKPFSINAMYYASIKAKTKEAREWSYQIFHSIDQKENQKSINDLKSYFDPKKHAYKIMMTAYYPESDIYRKDGALSSKVFDQTNWEKPLVDLLFLPKHSKKEVPYGANNLEIDDKYLKRIISSKEASPTGKHYIEIILHITSVRQ